MLKSIILMAVSFVLCTAMRFIQIAGGTDFNSPGFLRDENGWLINLGFYLLVLLTMAAAIILGILGKRKKDSYYTNSLDMINSDSKRATLQGFPLIMAGGLAAYEGYIQTTAIAPSGFLIFIDFLFGAALLAIGFIIIYMGRIPAAAGFSLVTVSIFCTLCGIGTFITHMAIATIPEYLIDSLSIIGFAVFFMQAATLYTGNETKSTRVVMASVGIPTAVMNLSNAVAVLLADILNPYGLAANIVENSVTAQAQSQPILEEQYYSTIYSFIESNAMDKNYYFMSYTPWWQVAMSLTVIAVLIAVGLKEKKAKEQIA